ncbi:MAG: MBL fold metallo-hydrolase [Treponemataceae bacterium]|nr:MBL fold metallo-hydrolase [Treponemataceae bacterium]
MRVTPLTGSLQLTNNGELSLFFVGVGSAFSREHYQTNLLVIKGNDHLLIDCGTICSHALWQYGSVITQIQNVLITHSHADHIGGLEEMAFMGRYVSGKKPVMYIDDNYKTILWDFSLSGGQTYGESLTGGPLEFEDYFTQVKPQILAMEPRPLYETWCENINIKLFRTKHMENEFEDWDNTFYSIGVLIDERILVTGDTRFDPELISWLTEKYPTIECIVHDCQLSDGGVHASYNELKNLPADIRSKTLLCHYGDNWRDYKPEADGFIGFARQGVYYTF